MKLYSTNKDPMAWSLGVKTASYSPLFNNKDIHFQVLLCLIKVSDYITHIIHKCELFCKEIH